MDLAYQADGTIKTQKVVQLKPNGKIANLPLATNLNVPTQIYSASAIRSINTDALAVVKLSDILYLVSYVNYDDTNPDPYRFLLLEKQSDGTFQEKENNISPWKYSSNAQFFKVSESKVLFFYNVTGSGATCVGVITLDGYALTFSAEQSMGQSPYYANIVKLKETAEKIYFIGITINGAASIFAFTYEKATDVVTWQVERTLYDVNTAIRYGNIKVISENKIVAAFIRQYTASSDHKYPMVGYFDIVYNEGGEVTSITQAGTLVQPPSILFNASYNNYYHGIFFKGDYVHFDVMQNSSGSYSYYDVAFKLTDPATNIAEYIGFKVQGVGTRNRAGVFYLKNGKEKWQYEVVNESNPSNTRVDMYARDAKDDLLIIPNILMKTWKFGKSMGYVSIFMTDVEEMFISYIDNTSPFVWYLATIDPNVNVATPIGVARSQSLVTLNGQCGGFNGLEIGKQYYYDENGDISTNPQGTYLGTAISSTTIFIEDTLF
ncbi:hypothetical protein [Brevibacillus centrosporus]|uniref:hypothetical protein n=1 Tax=Brevibacillus centrosporus TaxID=54910 RepID=UPI0038221850